MKGYSFLFFLLGLLITFNVKAYAPIAPPDSLKPQEKSALSSKVNYKAQDSMRFDIQNQKVYLFGNAEVYYEKTELKAHFIELDMKNNMVCAEGGKDSTGKDIGKPTFSDDGKNFKAGQMCYNFKTKKGRIIEVTTKEGEGYIHSDVVKKDSTNMYYIKDGKYTTCTHPNPHFYIAAKKLKVIPNDKIITGPAWLMIENIPTPLVLPFGLFPNKKGQKSGVLIPLYGESPGLGFFLRDGGYYFGFSDYMDLAIRGDIFSRGSWGLKGISNYNYRYHFNGNLNVRYSKIIQGDRELPTSSTSSEFFVTWVHNQDPKSNPNSRFTANVNAGSRSFNRFNITNPNNYLSNTFQSNVAWTKTFPGKPINLIVNARHSQNTINKKVDISLPEVTFSHNRQPLPFLKSKNSVGTHWYEKIYWSYTAMARNDISTYDSLLFKPQTLKQMRNGISHTVPLSTNFTVLKYFNTSINLNASSKMYLETIEKTYDADAQKVITDTIRGFRNALDGSVSASVNTRIYGTWLRKNPAKSLKGIRHVITPSLGFSTRPDFSNNKWGTQYKTVQTNASGATEQYSIFSSGIFGGAPAGKLASINWSVLNNIEAKYRPRKDTSGTDKKVSLLDAFSISGNYNYAAKHYKYSTINMNGRTRLFQKIDINFSGVVDPYRINDKGQRIEKFQFNHNKQIGRLTNGNVAVSTNLRKDGSKKKEVKNVPQSEVDFINAHPEAFVDFNIPWNLFITYNIQYYTVGIRDTITQTLQLSGDANVTKYWKIGFSTGVDLYSKKLILTNVSVYRNLHCWDMSINWIPFGPLQSYSIDIKVKSSVLQDLKLSRRREWYDFR